jgi:hypothetical protein
MEVLPSFHFLLRTTQWLVFVSEMRGLESIMRREPKRVIMDLYRDTENHDSSFLSLVR